MSTGANMRSESAFRDARAAMRQFAEEVASTLASVETEVQRVGQWLTLDRPSYWKHEIRRREDGVVAAKQEIERKILAAMPDPASTVLERKALDRAKRHVEEARGRAEASRRWAGRWEKEALSYRGACRGLLDFLGADVHRALERLDALERTLEEYASIAPPMDPAGASVERGGEGGMGRPDGDGESGGSASDEAEELMLRPGDFATLRRVLPTDRGAVAADARPEVMVGAAVVMEEDAAGLSRLAMERQGWRDDDRVVVAWGAQRSGPTALVRVAAGEGDSGWTVFPVTARGGGGVAGGWYAVSMGQFVAERPDLREVLSLGAGALVVVAGGRVRGVLGADDRDAWNVDADGTERVD